MIRVFKVAGDRLTEVESLEDFNPAVDTGWIDLLNPTAEEDRTVEDFLKISVPTKEDMQEIELSARLYSEEAVEYLTMLAISQVHIDDPIKSPVTFILGGNTLVTVRYNEFLSFSAYVQKAQKKNGVTIVSPGGMMADILESFVNRVADSLEVLGADMDTLSRDIFRAKNISVKRKTGMLQSAIRKIGGKGDLISMLRESLVTFARLLAHCNDKTDEAADKALRSRIRTLMRDVSSLEDHAGFLSSKMSFLLDATLGLINLEQNQIIKIFSIAAVVFLPPTLVASVYGMNFHHMPELDWLLGYPMALLAMLAAALVPLAYFKKKGWL
jgi:magnesium transporter